MQFEIKNIVSNTIHKTLPTGVDAIAVKDIFVLPMLESVIGEFNLFTSRGSYQVIASDIQCADDIGLKEHGISIARHINKTAVIHGPHPNYRICLYKFQHALLSAEYQQLCDRLQEIYQHLDKRMSMGKVLTQYDGIQQLIAKASGELLCIKQGLQQAAVLQDLALVKQNINTCLKYLVKLSGGRAFLTGSVIDMLCLFKFINNTYQI